MCAGGRKAPYKGIEMVTRRIVVNTTLFNSAIRSVFIGRRGRMWDKYHTNITESSQQRLENYLNYWMVATNSVRGYSTLYETDINT